MNVARPELHIHPLRLQAWRARLLLLGLLVWFIALAGRAVYLQGLNNDFLQQKGESRYARVIELPATRGVIVDRNHEPLAISTPVESVAASPADLKITPEQTARLAKLLDTNGTELARRLADDKREFVYLKRQLPPEQAARIVELNIPGVFLHREYRRYYPAGEVTAHLLGFTDIDDRGQEALEFAFNDMLTGKPGVRSVIKDRRGHIVEDVESIKAPQHGGQLKLSIDAKIQYLAFRELKKAVLERNAKAGGIVVLDVASGEVLAMANMPTYNPNNRGRLDPKRTRNRAVTDLFEPGSTLKPFTAAVALEVGLFKPETVIQTGDGKYVVGTKTIRDTSAHGAITVAQVIQKSSNVGSAKMALSLAPEQMWKLFNTVGFGNVPKSGFPGEVAGRVRPHASWKPIEQATMSYGHGISLSLLQLARAYSIFATDGQIRPITLVKGAEPPAPVQAISPETARAVRQMLELATQAGGTAPRAQISGYRVAGKTGTAHKLDGKGYAPDKYVSSFVGFAPATNPRLIIAVMIDEPTGAHYGGVVAAPVFAEVMAGALRLLAVPPDAPVNNVVLPPPSAEIREEV